MGTGCCSSALSSNPAIASTRGDGSALEGSGCAAIASASICLVRVRSHRSRRPGQAKMRPALIASRSPSKAVRRSAAGNPSRICGRRCEACRSLGDQFQQNKAKAVACWTAEPSGRLPSPEVFGDLLNRHLPHFSDGLGAAVFECRAVEADDVQEFRHVRLSVTGGKCGEAWRQASGRSPLMGQSRSRR